MKKFTALMTSLLLLLSAFPTAANYLYTQTESEKVANGITYEKRTILTENGYIRAYIAYVDLTNPNAAVKVMTASKGSSYLSTVKQMAQDNGAAVAINGDFFNFSSSQTNMLGMVYENGEMVSSPALDNMVTFGLTYDNQVIMDYFTFTATVNSPQGYTCPIYQINKIPVNSGAITMLTSKWASSTWGKDLKEVIVENDVVKEIREPNSGATVMPQNGYVLLTNPSVNGFFDNFSVGDPIKVDVTLSPNVNNIKEATGGNTLLLNNGQIFPFTSNVTGYAQRSAVGVSQDGKTLILLATDGRQTDCRGLSQTELANLMLSVGAYKAVNLDGGGSTTFVKQNTSGALSVENSVSSLRSIATSIGVFDNKLSSSEVAKGTLTAAKPLVLLGDTTVLYPNFTDVYGNSLSVDASQMELHDEAGNAITNSAYTPQSVGKHTVYATYNGITLQTEVEAIDALYAIDITDKTINLEKGASKALSVYGTDVDGRKLEINPSLLQWQSTDSNLIVANGTVSASEKVGGVISAKYGEKTDYLTVNKDLYGAKAPIEFNTTDTLYGSLGSGSTIAVSGNVPKGASLLNTYFSRQRLTGLAGYDASYAMSNYYSAQLPKNCVVPSGYSAKVIGSTTFVTLGTASGKIGDTSNWINLCIAALGTSKNVIVITQCAPSELPAEEEQKLRGILTNAANGARNVFLVTQGSETGVSIENKVRYITCGTVADYHSGSFASDALYSAYAVFSCSGDEIRYKFITEK